MRLLSRLSYVIIIQKGISLLNEKALNTIANVVTISTGIFAIGNFVYSLSHSFVGATITIPSIPSITLPFRLVALLITETILAYAFGWCLLKVEDRGRGIPMIMIWVVSLISAWTSLFNVQWLVIGETPMPFEFNGPYTLWFAILSTITLIIAIYLINVHNSMRTEPLENPACPFVQSVCFLIMFFIFLYGS